MSYILKAIRKAEQERRLRQSPGLHVPEPGGRGRAGASYILFALLVVNLVAVSVLLYFQFFRTQAPPAATSVSEAARVVALEAPEATELPSTQPPAAAKSGAAALPTPDAKAEQVDPGAAPIPEPALDPPASKPSCEPQEAAERTLESASEREMRKVLEYPGLSLSLHYYTTEPQRRMVRINGTLFHVGEAVSEDVVVGDILPEGVLLIIDSEPVLLQSGR